MALIAGLPAGIPEIRAARALQHIAAKGSHVAELLARCQLQRLHDYGIILTKLGVVSGLAHAHQGAQSRTLLVEHDAAEAGRSAQGSDVHDMLGSHDVKLHEVEQRRAARDIAHRHWRHLSDEGLGVLKPPVGQRAHDAFSIAGFGIANGGNNVGVSSAAAKIAAHEFADGGVRAGLSSPDAGDRRHDLAGRAIPALERVLLVKACCIGCKDQRTRRVPSMVLTGLPRQRPASGRRGRFCRRRAPSGSASPVIASLLRPGKSDVVAQRIEQRCACINGQAVRFIVYVQRELCIGRGRNSPGRPCTQPRFCENDPENEIALVASNMRRLNRPRAWKDDKLFSVCSSMGLEGRAVSALFRKARDLVEVPVQKAQAVKNEWLARRATHRRVSRRNRDRAP